MPEEKKEKQKDESKESSLQGFNVQDLKDFEKRIPEEVKKEIEKTKGKLQEFKKELLKKFPFVESIGILPPFASKILEEEEEVIKEREDERLIHLLIILPDEKLKELPVVKAEAIALVKDFRPRIWLHIKTRSMVWEACFDGKYELIDSYALSFPLHDSQDFLAALRLATIHKRMCLAKFERYVVSYVIAGSLVRGTAKKTSDVDVYLVIDDTDVKRMSRYELKEKLRAIIWSYAVEAAEQAGVKNKLNVQVYILTEFWEAVKDAHPVIFTFIRDGVPLYDRGAFMPWKLLLKMGKIKPSPEAIDLFMSLGEKVAENVKRKLNDIVLEDIWWGVITPSQAVLMLYGLAPPTPRETVTLMQEILVEKEKLLEEKYVKILEKIVNLYKKYEHTSKLEITGKDIDELLEEVSEYIERLKKLMKQIEEKIASREIKQQYVQVKELLKPLIGETPESSLLEVFKKKLVDKNKISRRNLILLKEILEIVKKHKKGKISKHDIANMHKAVHELSTALLEYIQRQEFIDSQKNKADIIYYAKEQDKKIKKQGHLFIFDNVAFLVPDVESEKIKKITGDKIQDSSTEELNSYLKKKASKKITPQLIFALKKHLGDFEIIF
ncbi:MAG: nucleotidyltransferase domain-containing protein [Candidatus Pacearchaeota archaeon]